MLVNEINKRYDCLLVDVVNLCYKIFKKEEDTPIQLGSKYVYKESICNFITSIKELSSNYLHCDGEIYLLFDNYFSRADLKTAFLFADRKKITEDYKSNRKKEKKEFYNSINFLKYYYLISSQQHHTIQIPGLEADDLVKPLLEGKCLNKSCLLISSDLDWGRYLQISPSIDWLPYLDKNIITSEDLATKLGFPVSERNIILYKVFFGDTSDNISKLVPENEENKKYFSDILKEISYPEDIILLSRDMETRILNPLLLKVAEDEKRFLINLQLVSSIPCDIATLEENITTGKASNNLLKIINEALGLSSETKQFVFGNVKRNRI